MSNLTKKSVTVAVSAAVTAYIVYCCVGKTLQTTTQNKKINSLFQDVEEDVKKKIMNGTIDMPDTFNFTLLYHNREKSVSENRKSARNIYYNICDNSQVFIQFQNTFSILDKKIDFINLEKLIGLKTFESNYTHCIRCGETITRQMKNGGKVCVSYGHLEGPQVGISYIKRCKDCQITYFYGKIVTQNMTKRMNLENLDYFELTPYTYFKKDIFTMTIFHLFENARGFEKFVQFFNLMHKNQIQKLKEKLSNQSRKLGKRQHQLTPHLESNRLIEAFHLYTLQVELESKCSLNLQITKTEYDELLKKKENRIALQRSLSKSLSQSQSSSQSSNKSNTHIGTSRSRVTNVDLFDFWYNKHEQDIKCIDSEILNLVPVHKETGEILIGHFISMMDGNAKNIRFTCGYPVEDQVQDLCNDDTDTTNLSKESIKCANSPQHPNKFSKGFKCCHYHVGKLVEKGLDLHQIDKYVDWKWFTKTLKSTQDSIKSNELTETKKEKNIKKIKVIEKKIKVLFTADDLKKFKEISRYGLIPRRSSRIQSNKVKANLNEKLIMENDSEILELFENWFGEPVNPDILQYKKQLLEIYKERENDEAIDELEGCRSGQNTINPQRNRIGGIFCISTLSGFIVALFEYVHRETPTEITSDAVEAFTLLPSNRNYFERMEALGFDNMCNLQKKVHVSGKNDLLTQLQAYFWNEMLYRTFVDSFHIAKHVCPLCDKNHPEGLCCFDSNLKKFQNIFKKNQNNKDKEKKKMAYTKINDEIVEQLWKQFNQMKFLLHTNKNHFRWLLYLKKKYYNEKRKKQIEEKGYEFIDIDNFRKLRNLKDFETFSWDKTKTTTQIHTKNNEILSTTIRIRKSNRKRSYSQMQNDSKNELKNVNNCHLKNF